MLLLKYDLEAVLECEPRIKECCEPDKKPGDPAGSGDCCFDTWTKEFKGIDAEYTRADKRVTNLTNRLTHLGTQRDMWKTWRDELDNACTSSKKICDQLEIVLHHTARISRNVWLTKKSINLLYCMLRDFFMQIDHLKKKYVHLINCIKCINNPTLVSGSGQGIMVFIDAYGAKLDLVIQTRDALIEQVISAISIVNNINKNIGHQGHNYGLHAVLIEWKRVFSCEQHRRNDDDDNERRRYDSGRGDRSKNTPEGEVEDIGLEPVFKFPICESDYYKKVDNRYKDDNGDYNKLSKQLLHETKHRDNLKALRDGLTAVMADADVDPSKRCGTNGTNGTK